MWADGVEGTEAVAEGCGGELGVGDVSSLGLASGGWFSGGLAGVVCCAEFYAVLSGDGANAGCDVFLMLQGTAAFRTMHAQMVILSLGNVGVGVMCPRGGVSHRV